MKFYGISKVGIVYTDDYSDNEIKNGLVVKNLSESFQNILQKFPQVDNLIVDVFDVNGNHFVKFGLKYVG